MKYFIEYVKYRLSYICVCAVCIAIFVAVFAGYGLPLTAVLYPTAICSAIAACFLVFRFVREYRKRRELSYLCTVASELIESVPNPSGGVEEDYRELVMKLKSENTNLQNYYNRRFTEMSDYYTAWAHQIKTPIASMSLRLQNEDTVFSRELTLDLKRIEQYVEMVLAYLRLDSDSHDWLFREYPLDKIVREAVKKLSSQFILKKLKLDYSELGVNVVTDEKWLGFVIEQVLSNSLKYTSTGGVSIYLEEPLTLCIRDTGIGIAPEDLPRIFEKGYTGYNGREDKKASGLGLYLCRRICNSLGNQITAESVPGEGTTVKINLSRRKLMFD